MIGIYFIENLRNGKIYIGSSVEVEKRIKQHKSMLNRGVHTNAHLQSVYNKYGLNIFDFYLVQECTKKDLLVIEQKYIDAHKKENLYNMSYITGSGGGGCLKGSHIANQFGWMYPI